MATIAMLPSVERMAPAGIVPIKARKKMRRGLGTPTLQGA
jgi:hypothetical protein